MVKAVKERVSKLEGGQKILPTVPQVKSHIVLEDLPSVNTTPHMNQLPQGSVQREINGMPYYIIPLQAQNVDK